VLAEVLQQQVKVMPVLHQLILVTVVTAAVVLALLVLLLLLQFLLVLGVELVALV
jgi:hypothetical protein